VRVYEKKARARGARRILLRMDAGARETRRWQAMMLCASALSARELSTSSRSTRTGAHLTDQDCDMSSLGADTTRFRTMPRATLSEPDSKRKGYYCDSHEVNGDRRAPRDDS
jgi:hypothetical protein